MAIANYVATATPVAGGNSVTGYVIYDGTKSYIIPSSATVSVAPDTGVVTVTPATVTDIVEVTPDSVKMENLNLQSKTISELEANSGAIQADEGYDGLGSVTISSVKLQNISSSPSEEEVSVVKTEDTAWGLGTVTVSAIRIDSSNNSATPSLSQQVKEPEAGKYFKQFTVNAAPLAEAVSVMPTREEQTVDLGDGNIGIKGVTIQGYLPSLQVKEADPSEMEQDIVADEGFDGLEKVTISPISVYTPSAVTPSAEVQTISQENSYMKSVTVNAVPAEEETITATKEQQVLTPETGKWYSKVTVNGYTVNLQDKSVDPEESEISVSADAEYDGLGTVTVSPIQTETKEVTISSSEQVIIPTEGKYLKSVIVEPYTPNLHEVVVDELSVGQVIHKEELYDGISQVIINGVKLENVSVKSSLESQTVTKTDPTAWGISQVTVEPISLEAKTVSDLAKGSDPITATEGFDGLSSVTISSVKLQSGVSVTPSAVSQEASVTDSASWGLDKVTVESAPLDEAITVQSGKDDETKTPENLGFKSVVVKGDSNLVPENIKQNVSILGVKGKYKGPDSGTDENGYLEGDWVALDLPASITRSESFRALPYYNDHYLGKTFDGGDYMGVVVYSRCGREVITVMLNDILGKYYLEKVTIEGNPFPEVSGNILNLYKDVDASEIDWNSIMSVNGNGNKITVATPLVSDNSLLVLNSDFVSDGATSVVSGEGTVSFERCSFTGFSQVFNGESVYFKDCEFNENEKTRSESYLIEVTGESIIILESSTFNGSNGLKVSSGSVKVEACTFNTSSVGIEVAGGVKQLSLQGNIHNDGTQLKIDDEVTDVSGISIIGSPVVEGKYVIDGTQLKIDDEVTDVPEPDPGTSPDAKFIKFMNEFDKTAISNYLVKNKDAVMSAFGVTEDSSAIQIGELLYDKLQGGDTISVNMSDGGVLDISGHFYEPSDDLPYWDMYITYKVPEGGTSECFPEGSQMSVKNGEVVLHALNAELTSYGEWNTVLLIYSYDVTITDVTVVDGEDSWVLNMSNFTYPMSYSDPCVIDPDSSTWEIYVRQFFLPPKEADATITVDSDSVIWADVVDVIEK